MRSLSPPTTATWLLDKFGYGNHALAGDLVEEFGRGRSAAWYWRQVLVAVVIGFAKEIRAHKLVSLRALATGWATWYLFLYAVEEPLYRFYAAALTARGLPITVWWLHYYLYPALPITWIVAAACGWAVGRFHRGHRQAMVLLYFASVEIWLLPELLRLTVDVFTNRRFLPYLLSHLLEIILISSGVLVGGLWSAPRKRAVLSH